MKDVKTIENETAEPTMDEIKKQLFETRQAYVNLRNEAQKKIAELDYTNAFNQQSFMFKIVELSGIFEKYDKKDIVEKAINYINNFWFKQEEVTEEEK